LLKGILIPNEEKSLVVSVKNVGSKAINKCQIKSDDPQNFESSQISNIASGEIIDFPIILKIIDEIPNITVKCLEGEDVVPLDLLIYESKLSVEIIKINLGVGKIIVEYSLESEFGLDNILIFEITNSKGDVLRVVEQFVSFESKDGYSGEVIIPLSEEVNGLLNLAILYDESVLIDSTFIYGDSLLSTTGLVARELFSGGTKLTVWFLLLIFNVAAFFVIRKVWINIYHPQEEKSIVN